MLHHKHRFALVPLTLLTLVVPVLTGCGGGGTQITRSEEITDLDDPAKVTEVEPEEAREEIPVSRMIGNDKRKAVFFEAFYALRKSWLRPPNESGPFGGNQIDGAVVGDWSYLASDTIALNDVTNRINRTNASITSGSMTASSYTMKDGYERTGQCLFFVALILRRALGYKDLPLSWNSYPTYGPSARNAIPGDVVYYKHSDGNHIGIVVLKTNDGIDVVDSNFVGYGKFPIAKGAKSSEIIGRHWLSNSTIDNGRWMVFRPAKPWY